MIYALVQCYNTKEVCDKIKPNANHYKIYIKSHVET